MDDSSNLSKQVRIDPRLEQYETFFNHSWAKDFMDQSKGTKYESCAFDLCVSWRAAANTHVLPWLLIRNLRSFAHGLWGHVPTVPEKLTELLTQRIVGEIRTRGSILDTNQTRALQSSVDHIHKQAEQLCANLPFEFDEAEVWGSFLSVGEFQMSLWGSQRLCYAAIYFAYEDFLISVYKLASGLTRSEQYRLDPRDPGWSDFASKFGTDLRDSCWTDFSVEIPRLIRHALVHNGGRLTTKLKGKKHGMFVEGEEIQIVATDSRNLFDCLKAKASALLKCACQLASGDQ